MPNLSDWTPAAGLAAGSFLAGLLLGARLMYGPATRQGHHAGYLQRMGHEQRLRAIVDKAERDAKAEAQRRLWAHEQAIRLHREDLRSDVRYRQHLGMEE